MDLTYNKPLEIKRYIGDDLMELEDGSVLRLLSKKPGKEGEKIILKKNHDPKPGGPKRLELSTLIIAVNVKGGEQPVAEVKSPQASRNSTAELKKNYSPSEVKTHQDYKILEIYPDRNSFSLECGTFIIDLLSIPRGKKFDYGEDDTIVLYPSASALGKKNKFKAVNKTRNDQEAGVMLLQE